MREVQVSVSAVSGIGNQKFRYSLLWVMAPYETGADSSSLLRQHLSRTSCPGISDTGAECGNFYIAATVTAGDADLYLDSNKNIEYHIYLYYCSHSV